MVDAVDPASVAVLRDDLLIGTCLGGRFRLCALIGAGAYGRVYRAEQVALRRDVAIKILEPRLGRDPEFVNQLHAEALITSRLNHPNIVSVIDFGTENGLVYVAMEYLRGCTLTMFNAQRWPLPLARIGNIMRQILLGLEEAHAAGIVHADLKSDNILVEQRTAGDLVKVVDFGIARLLDPIVPRNHAGAPQRVMISGTPEYMAPEVIRGHKPGETADLYAAGVVLYELLCGRPPFAHPSFMQVLRKHVEEPVPAVAVMRPDAAIPAALEAALYRALAKAPAARYQSAAGFREAIEAALAEGEPPSGAAPRPRTAPWVRRAAPASSIQEPAIDHAGEHAGRGVPDPRRPTVPSARRAGAGARSAGAAAGVMRSTEPAALGDQCAEPAMEPAVLRAAAGAMESGSALATTLDFCLGGGCLHALQITGQQPEHAAAVAATAIERLGDGVRVLAARADASPVGRRWHPIRGMLRAALGLPACPDAVALRAAAAGLGARARAGLLAVFADAAHEPPAPRRHQPMARLWNIARAIKDAAQVARQGPEQVILWFEDVHRYDPESREVVRVLCAGYLGAELRAVLTAAAPFDIGVADGVMRVAWTCRSAAPGDDRDRAR